MDVTLDGLNNKVTPEGKKDNGKAVAEDDRGQKITASGGSAINTAVFVQNANQLRKLLSPEYCSVGKIPNFTFYSNWR